MEKAISEEPQKEEETEMANIPEINIGGTNYQLKDATAREQITDLKSALSDQTQAIKSISDKADNETKVVNNRWLNKGINDKGEYIIGNTFIISEPIFDVHNNLRIDKGDFVESGIQYNMYIWGFDRNSGEFSTYLTNMILNNYSPDIDIQNYINRDFDATVCWVAFRKFVNNVVTAFTEEEIARANANIVVYKDDFDKTVLLTSKISSYYREAGLAGSGFFYTRPVAADWIYIGNYDRRVHHDATDLRLEICSHSGGTAKIYLINPATWIVLKIIPVTLRQGSNTVNIDVSPYYCDIMLGFYSDVNGALAYQSAYGGANIEFPWGDVLPWYANPNGVAEGSRIVPNYWNGNVTTNKQYLCVTVYETRPVPVERANVIHVDKNGGGDFRTIADALRNAGDIGNNKVTIIIHPGEYNEIVYLDSDNHISLKGIDRDQCIIYQVGGKYQQQPVMIQGEGSVENLTLKMLVDGSFTPTYGQNVMDTYPGYALHLDGDQEDKTKQIIKRVSNCTLYSEAFPAIGAGCNQNQYVVIENCELIRNSQNSSFHRSGWEGAIVMHASNTPTDVNCVWMLKDCVVKSNYGYAGNILVKTSMAQTEFTTIAIDNTFYSEEMDSADYFDYTKRDSILSPMSHGNTVSSLNYTSP